MMLFFISFPIAFLIYGHKKYWIVAEVDFDARDNGIHFFKFVRLNHPEINIAFLISKKNPNYKMVKEIGKTIEPYSYKHMLIFIAAKAKISTAVHGCSPSSYITLFLLKHHCTGKNVALKHGIFKNLHSNYFKENAHLDLICCGAKPEFDFIKKEFGYEDGVAQYTGLARFDKLHNLKLEKEIFIMPTWRRWLDGVNDLNTFKESDYFQNWFNLLNSKEFINIVESNNLKVCFYVHPKLNKFLSVFSSLDEHVMFLNSLNGDSIQEHLKKASILITDYSSVFFDFAYMKKPSIYYQFDENKYYESHYIKAYFDYRDNGFGKVCTESRDAISELNDIISNKLVISDYYKDRCDKYFVINDTNNCERIYCAILKFLTK